MRLTFDKHNREHSQFLFQCGNFSSTRGGGELVSQKLELLEEEEEEKSSPCLALRQSEVCFQTLNPS